MTLPPQAPTPPQPLEYAIVRPRRPGTLTAVGVISIALGSVSIIASLGGVATAILLIVASSDNSNYFLDIAPSNRVASSSNGSSVQLPLRIGLGTSADDM